MTGVTFIVPGSPIGKNRAYRRGRGKHLYKTDEARSFQEKVNWLARIAASSGEWDQRGQKGVQLLFFFDSNRPDLDGPEALILDAMQKALYRNDRQVVDKITRKRIDTQNPRVEITVWNVLEVEHVIGSSEARNRKGI